MKRTTPFSADTAEDKGLTPADTVEDKDLIPVDIIKAALLIDIEEQNDYNQNKLLASPEQIDYNQSKYLATPEQIDVWKKEYGVGNVLRIDVVVSKADIATGYFVLPHAKGNDKCLAIYSRAIQKLQDKDTVGAGVFLISNCFLSGDPRMQGTDSRVYASAAMEIVAKMDFFPAKSRTI